MAEQHDNSGWIRLEGASYQDYLIESLKRDPLEVEAYIAAALEDGDFRILLAAVRNVAKAYEGADISSELTM